MSYSYDPYATRHVRVCQLHDPYMSLGHRTRYNAFSIYRGHFFMYNSRKTPHWPPETARYGRDSWVQIWPKFHHCNCALCTLVSYIPGIYQINCLLAQCSMTICHNIFISSKSKYRITWWYWTCDGHVKTLQVPTLQHSRQDMVCLPLVPEHLSSQRRTQIEWFDFSCSVIRVSQLSKYIRGLCCATQWRIDALQYDWSNYSAWTKSTFVLFDTYAQCENLKSVDDKFWIFSKSKYTIFSFDPWKPLFHQIITPMKQTKINSISLNGNSKWSC